MPNDTIWKEYKRTKDKRAKEKLKEKLIIDNIEIVKVIAGKLFHSYNSNVDYEDLVSYGILGLIDAIEKYDPNKNVKFETYASFRIRGAIIDQIRSLDWVPRSTRQKYKKLEEAMENLQKKYGFDISDSALSKELEMSIDEVRNFLSEASIYSVISLDEKLSENSNFYIPSNNQYDNPEQKYLKNETISLLKKAIENLPERERMIINLYYFSNLTYKEIAKIIGISESRVSQLHTKCLIKLRNAMD